MAFRVPRWGVYFFTYSAFLSARTPITLELRVNGQAKFGLIRQSTIHNDNDMVSRTAMLLLRARDEVTVHLSGGSIRSSATETAWAGFLYSPRGARAAWSVYRSRPWDANIEQCSETLIYDEVILDEGGFYNSSSGKVNIKVTGVYYISLNAGVNDRRRMNVQLMVDGTLKASLSRTGEWHNNIDTLSRSVVLKLERGSVVSVWADGGATNDMFIWSDVTHKVTSFMGMLMYESNF